MESFASNDYDVYRDSGKLKQHVFGIHRLFQKIQGLSAVCLGGPQWASEKPPFRLGPEATCPTLDHPFRPLHVRIVSVW